MRFCFHVFSIPLFRFSLTSSSSSFCSSSSSFLSLSPCSSLTISETLKQSIQIFRQKSISEPKLSAQYLLAHVRGCSRRKLLSTPKHILSQKEHEHFMRLCKERLQHTPIQYIVGKWGFREISLFLRKPVLIPRPETEQLVDLILASYDEKPLTFVEVGVGSGAICLSLLKERPAWKATGIDISAEAVELTRHNAQALGVIDRLSLHIADVHTFTPQTLSIGFIVSNPPYIPSKQVDKLEPEVLHFEDRRALDGGEDGMDLIKTLILRALSWLPEKGNIWLEVDLSHLLGRLQNWMQSAQGVKMTQTYPDFTNRLRFCCLSKIDDARPQI